MTDDRTILGIDPGLRALGVAVLGPRARLRHVGVLTAPRTLTLTRRLARLAEAVDELLVLYRPDLVVLETTWASQNPSLALLHRAARLCDRRVRARKIPLVSVPSTTVRRHLLGSGWAAKRQTAQVLASRYPELRIYLRQDRAWKEQHFANLFDALALSLYARQTHLGR